MDALVVLDNSLTCYDMLELHCGVYGQKEELKCDFGTSEKKSMRTNLEFVSEKTLSSQIIEKHLVNCVGGLNSIEDALKNENSSEEILPQPYSILDSSNPRNHFHTLLIKRSTSPCIESSILVLSIDSYLASAIKYTLMNNQTFCIGFSNFVRELFKRGGVSSRQSPRKTNKNRLDWTVFFLLHQPRKYVINYKWCNVLQVLVTKRMILEELMAWLSTLGGGYSSLGDFVVEHAEEAGRISIQQLKIALELGDAIVQCKCRMFFALSLMQKGQLRKSKQLLRKEFMFIKEKNFQDDKVKNMWKALWVKLGYLYQERTTRSKPLRAHANGTAEHINISVS
ncbi:uncharacterized protein LOC135482924 [Lineus longissimus]|uniref:uncharacterized protein LOC135482924 n=1 Tax=Lineus longissimus TaxID=88925 RepID=UPI002B4E9D06